MRRGDADGTTVTRHGAPTCYHIQAQWHVPHLPVIPQHRVLQRGPLESIHGVHVRPLAQQPLHHRERPLRRGCRERGIGSPSRGMQDECIVNKQGAPRRRGARGGGRRAREHARSCRRTQVQRSPLVVVAAPRIADVDGEGVAKVFAARQVPDAREEEKLRDGLAPRGLRAMHYEKDTAARMRMRRATREQRWAPAARRTREAGGRTDRRGGHALRQELDGPRRPAVLLQRRHRRGRSPPSRGRAAPARAARPGGAH